MPLQKMTKCKFLCVDIGTTSLKTALVSENGQVLSFSRISFNSAKQENAPQSAIALEWIDALKKAISETALLKQEQFLDCDAICISGNGPTIVSEDGTTLLWNETFDFENSVSKEFSKSLFLPRINAFKKKFPPQFAEQKIFSGPEFLIWKLCGAHITILPEARYESAYWNDAALESVGASPAQFGRMVAPGCRCGTVTNDACRFFNIKNETPVIAGGPDFIAAMIGTNSLAKGKIYDCAGSSEGINLCTDVPFSKPGLRTLPSVIPGLWNIAVLMPSSGKKFVGCKKSFESSRGTPLSYEEYISYCFEHKDSEGFLTIDELARSVKDAVALLKKYAEENNAAVNSAIMVTGGQTKNSQWMQYKADVARHTFCVAKVPDSELIGDAVLASFALGIFSSIQEAAQKIVIPEKTFFPSGTIGTDAH